ncbi:MAG: hypothetical protein K2N49_00290, partial [Ruminococcus sp.]|nr:hypothetical protein [Ruminococcus sp.]
STDLNAPPPEIIPEQTKSTGKTSNTNTSYHTTKTFQAVSTTKITEPKTTSQQSATVSTTEYIDNPPAVVPQPTQTNPEQNVTTTPVEDVVPPVCADPVGNFAVPPVTYQKDENAVYVYDIFRAGGSPGNISPSEPSDNASNDTQSIICAEIVDVIYTQFNNKPYTQLNLLVKYPLSGNIREYSKISLYVRGGYMPASEYAELNGFNYEHNTDSETIIYDYGESEKIFDISDVGSEYIFLIRYDSRNLPENVYMTVTDSDKSIISPDDFQS